MTIYLGADHRGFALKERLKTALANDVHEVVDVGAVSLAPDDDYPDFAAAVANKVSADPVNARGIVICGSGFGVDIVANKFKGVRAMLATSPDHAAVGRHDDDANVLALAADFTGPEQALEIAKAFLSTPFAKDERYARRIEKIAKIETEAAR